jgi:hypothetical protein
VPRALSVVFLSRGASTSAGPVVEEPDRPRTLPGVGTPLRAVGRPPRRHPHRSPLLARIVHDGSWPFDLLRVPSLVEGRNRSSAFLVKRISHGMRTHEFFLTCASRLTNDASRARAADPRLQQKRMSNAGWGKFADRWRRCWLVLTSHGAYASGTLLRGGARMDHQRHSGWIEPLEAAALSADEEAVQTPVCVEDAMNGTRQKYDSPFDIRRRACGRTIKGDRGVSYDSLLNF